MQNIIDDGIPALPDWIANSVDFQASQQISNTRPDIQLDHSLKLLESNTTDNFYTSTHKKKDLSAYTVHAYHSRGYDGNEMLPIPIGKIVGKTGNAEGKPKCKWWFSEPHAIKNVFEFDAWIEKNRNKDIALCLDGPSDKVLDDTSTHRIIDDECHHVRRKAFSICDEPKYITFIDIDGVDCPAGIDPMSPEGAEYCISGLPPPFNNGTYFYQYSSSAGLAKKDGQISIHLAVFTDIPLTNLQRKVWFKENCKNIKVDLSIYDAVSLYFTREPKFIDGAIDPFKKAGNSRTGIILGENFTIDAHEVASVVIEHTFTAPNQTQKTSRAYSLTNSFKLFERNECYNSVMQITKNLVVKYGPKLDIAQAVKSVQLAAKKAADSGKLTITSAREKTLSDDFIRQALEGAIKKGFSAQLVSITNINLSNNDKYEAALNAGISNDRRLQDLAYTALYYGQNLIGIRFSADELVQEVFTTHVVGGEAEAGIKARFYARLAYQKKELMHSLDLSDTIDKTVENVEIIKINYLSEVKVNKDNVTLLKAGMGIGKTSKTGAEECKAVNRNAMAISHRVTLTGALSNVLGLRLYTDNSHNLPGYAGCVNSIYKENRTLSPELFLVDEFSQVLDSVMMSSRMNNRDGVYKALTMRINETNKVLGMDAGLCDRDIVALRRMTDKKIVIYVLPEADEGIEVVVVSAKKRSEHIPIQMAIAENKPFVLCSDSKKYITSAHEHLKNEGLKGLCITSEKRNPKAVADMDTYIKKHKPDYLLFSPAISSGISITEPYFEDIYCVYHSNIPPADMIQMTRRVRTIKKMTMVVTKARSGAKVDIEEKEKGLKLVSGVSDTRYSRDKLSQERLEFEKHAALQMSASAVCLYELMIMKQWKVSFFRTSGDLDKLAEDINNIRNELKEKFISNVINAKLIDDFTLRELSQKNDKSEQEQLQVIKGFMCKQAGKQSLVTEDVKYLARFAEGFIELKFTLGERPEVETTTEKEQLCAHRALTEEKFYKTTYKLRNKLLKASSVNLIDKQLTIDVKSLAGMIKKHKERCVALGIIDSLSKKAKDAAVTKNFFTHMGLNQRKVRNKDNYYLDSDLLELALGFIENKKGSTISPIYSRTKIKRGKRYKQLAELISTHQYAIMTSAWIIEYIDSINNKKSAEKWMNNIEHNFYEYKIKLKYKGGRYTNKKVVTKFDEKSDLLKYLKTIEDITL